MINLVGVRWGKEKKQTWFLLFCHNQLNKWYYLSGNGEKKKVADLRQGIRISYWEHVHPTGKIMRNNLSVFLHTLSEMFYAHRYSMPYRHMCICVWSVCIHTWTHTHIHTHTLFYKNDSFQLYHYTPWIFHFVCQQHRFMIFFGICLLSQ